MFPARHRRLGRAGPTVRVPRRLPVLLAVVGVVLLLGVVGGATWAAITPTATAEAVQGGFIIRSPEEAARLFSSVATFGFVMAVYGLVAALVAFLAYGFLVPGIQSNNISSSVEYAFGIDPWITATIVTTGSTSPLCSSTGQSSIMGCPKSSS